LRSLNSSSDQRLSAVGLFFFPKNNYWDGTMTFSRRTLRIMNLISKQTWERLKFIHCAQLSTHLTHPGVWG
jgi:hypothetical protein